MENISHKQLLGTLHYDPINGSFRWVTPRRKIQVGAVAGSIHPSGYIRIEIDGKSYAAHRLAWFYITQKWPIDQIDHMDRNKANNAFSNLRIATNGQNRANSKTTNKHGFKGVIFKKFLKKKPYAAQITFQKKVIHIGCFQNPEEAHEAYKAKAMELHGEFFGT